MAKAELVRDELGAVLDRQAISDTIVKLFVSTDRRDRPAVEGCFAPTVTFDMTSVVGGEPARLAPAQITAAWAAGLVPITTAHHRVGNFQSVLGGAEATAACYGVAWHERRVQSRRNTRTFGGSYDFHLVRTPEA